MFSRFSRLPLRRYLHTSSGAASATSSLGRSARVAFGVSAVTAAYVTWQLTQTKNQISMDSPRTMNSTDSSTTAKSSRTVEAPSEFVSTISISEIDVFVPDGPSTPDNVPEVEGETTEETAGEPEAERETPSDEAPSGGAFNPETGEINWDCPCLGGMAHGPCGPEFREAFSCFVFSEAEPKGINCVEKFQNMQNCFRAHPDVYADEIMNDDDDDAAEPVDGSSDVPPVDNTNNETLAGDAPSATENSPIDNTPVTSSS